MRFPESQQSPSRICICKENLEMWNYQNTETKGKRKILKSEGKDHTGNQ